MTRGTPIPETVTIHVPFRVVKRGGRKEMQVPEGGTHPARTDNTLVKALAGAFPWKRILESAEFVTIAELANREGSASSYMTRVLRLTLLAPDIVEGIRDDRLVPASDWDLSTRDGEPRAYRLSVSEAGGGRTQTALAGEVLHLRIGSDPVAPWLGAAPLRRAQLTAGMLHAVETALSEAFKNMPLGSQIVAFPETEDTDLTKLARGFKGARGKLLLRESVQVTAGAGLPLRRTGGRAT